MNAKQARQIASDLENQKKLILERIKDAAENGDMETCLSFGLNEDATQRLISWLEKENYKVQYALDDDYWISWGDSDGSENE